MPSGMEYATVERPWVRNEAAVSCIPLGEYDCSPRYYNRGGYEAVLVKDVPNRSYIMFHIANYPSDVQGCIGVCTTHGYTSSGMWGRKSTKAFRSFMLEVQKTMRLRVRNYPGGLL
jgi:hypothetical protein